MAEVIAVCLSKTKGVPKKDVQKGDFKPEYGMVGDAHADSSTHRQVSLLAEESINRMKAMGFDVGPGIFAENITTRGIDLLSIPVGKEISIGKEVVLRITQHGKECHTGCAIFNQIGKCIMPKEGVFARVVKGGIIKKGDTIKLIEDNGCGQNEYS